MAQTSRTANEFQRQSARQLLEHELYKASSRDGGARYVKRDALEKQLAKERSKLNPDENKVQDLVSDVTLGCFSSYENGAVRLDQLIERLPALYPPPLDDFGDGFLTPHQKTTDEQEFERLARLFPAKMENNVSYAWSADLPPTFDPRKDD